MSRYELSDKEIKKPEHDDTYFYFGEDGLIHCHDWFPWGDDVERWESGNFYWTFEEALAQVEDKVTYYRKDVRLREVQCCDNCANTEFSTNVLVPALVCSLTKNPLSVNKRCQFYRFEK